MRRAAAILALALLAPAHALAEQPATVRLEISGAVAPACRIGAASAPSFTAQSANRPAGSAITVGAPIRCNTPTRFFIRAEGGAWAPVAARIDGRALAAFGEDGAVLDRGQSLLSLDLHRTGGAALAGSAERGTLVF